MDEIPKITFRLYVKFYFIKLDVTSANTNSKA